MNFKTTDLIEKVFDLNNVLTDDNLPFMIILDFHEPHSIISKKLSVSVTPVNITPKNSILFHRNNAQNLSKENLLKSNDLTFLSLSIQINDRKKRNVVQEYIDRIVDVCEDYDLNVKIINSKGLILNTTIYITKN